MAITSVKATYSLDVETVKALGRLAELWGVPKSEALRRVIRMAAERHAGIDSGRTTVLDELQRSVGLAGRAADAWIERSRRERSSSARSREGRVE